MKAEDIIPKISSDIMFEFDNSKKIGHIRCQYGNQNQIANQFVPAENMTEKVKKHHLNIPEINKVCNILQYDWIQNYLRLESLCDNKKPNDKPSLFYTEKKETNYFLQYKNVSYWIRLNPFGTENYNCYIHIYHP